MSANYNSKSELPKRKVVKRRVVRRNVIRNDAVNPPVKRQISKRNPTMLKVNGSYYPAIRKKLLSLRNVVYDIDVKYHIDIQQTCMTIADLNRFIKTIIKDDETTIIDTNYQKCIIEQLSCFLVYPKEFSKKQEIWSIIIKYIIDHKIEDSYDILRKYDIDNFMLGTDIISIFDNDVDKIILHVKSLKNHWNIMTILTGLNDNNAVRIIFENEDMNEIILNNYETINIDELEKIIPIEIMNNKIIKLMKQHTADPKCKVFPTLQDVEINLLEKHMFSYGTSNTIKRIVKHYKIQLTDEHMRYYKDNKNWTENIFSMLIRSGITPDVDTVVKALKPHIRHNARSRTLLGILDKAIKK